MNLNLTIKGKLYALSLLGLAFVVVVGATGFVSTGRLMATGEDISGNASALRNQMQADMAHDALRADVLAAILAGEKKDAADEKAVKDDLASHSKQFRESLKDLEAMPLDSATRASITKVRPALDAYLASATSTIALAFTDHAAAKARMGDFMVSFKSLEVQMEALGELIENKAKEGEAAGQATGGAAKVAIGGAIALSIAALLVLGSLTSRSIVKPIQRAVEIAQTVSSGDLSSKIEVTGHGETAQLLAALKRMNDSLVKVVGSVRSSSDSIATGSSEISNGNYDLSQRTEEQASNLQQTAASMEQLTAAVRNNADTTRHAAQLADTASEAATQGGVAVGQVVSTMAEITQASRKINDIIGVIDGIAFPTTILALNAAVEAARAGEQGRGFAVVAQEVRALAGRSGTAAKEIRTLIGASVEQIGSGSHKVQHAGETMQKIVSSIERVSAMVTEMSTANSEQASGFEQVNTAVGHMDQATQQNAALVEEAAAAAESLKQQSKGLMRAIEVFKTA